MGDGFEGENDDFHRYLDEVVKTTVGRKHHLRKRAACRGVKLALKIAPMNVFERQRPFYGPHVPAK